jgi:ABC-type polysaccharide/polyol phosphate export permease
MNTAKNFLAFFTDILKNRKMLLGLAKNDCRAKFASSFLGIVWAFIQPLVTILVFWFVFQVGFKNPPVSDVPFIIWFLPAYLAWTFFSEALVSGANCLMEYSYLVKKVNFRVSMIPVVKILSSAFVHLAFIVFIFIMVVACGVPLSIYNIQVIYYFLCTCILLLGLCWLFAAIAPFIKDMVNIIGVIIQIGFWMTPIFWNVNEMAPWVQNILKLNPMFYICRGYRDCFVDHVWFWQHGYTSLYFWGITLILLFTGAYLFRRMRPQFADVL